MRIHVRASENLVEAKVRCGLNGEGAAGSTVQNLNIMVGAKETEGLI